MLAVLPLSSSGKRKHAQLVIQTTPETQTEQQECSEQQPSTETRATPPFSISLYTDPLSVHLLPSPNLCLPTVSYHALHRAERTIKDFVLSYFPLHRVKKTDTGADVDLDLFSLLPILMFVEGTIYQADEEHEQQTLQMIQQPSHIQQQQQQTDYMADEADVLLTEPRLWHIACVLSSQQLLSSLLYHHLLEGQLYWQQEYNICQHLSQCHYHHRRHQQCHSQKKSCSLTLAQVLDCSQHKSFDYRVLHALLFIFTQRACHADPSITPNASVHQSAQQLMYCLSLNEWLVDVHDDCVDYEDDIFANSFNVLRGIQHVQGSTLETELYLVADIQRTERQYVEALAALPSSIAKQLQDREKQEMVRSGATHWVLPEWIDDEFVWRAAQTKQPEEETQAKPGPLYGDKKKDE